MDRHWLFITGMFRSGTTLVAIMCHNHRGMKVATDPLAHLFRAARNQVALRLRPGAQLDFAAPMDDYYFSAEKAELLEAILEGDFSERASGENLAWLRENVNSTVQKFAPELGAFPTDRLEQRTFAEAFGIAIDLVRRAAPGAEWPGFKQVWMGEFAEPLVRALPGGRVIHVVRDPRAVCASKNVRDAKYPWLFMIRHWRKNVLMAWRAQQRADPSQLVLRYEDVVRDPEASARAICSFLKIDFDPKMIEAAEFRDGSGQTWNGNSSYQERITTFDAGLAEKWRRVLKPEELRLIEALCAPEMAAFGYELESAPDPEESLRVLLDPPEIPIDELAAWIRPYASPYTGFPQNQMSHELLRTEALRHASAVPASMQRLLFLQTEFFKEASAASPVGHDV
ncbi:MAG: sulfotransferase [Verrucomicrobiae bacterium]|nr:sulfotransferase [Verrucomicrobiae bacterium]